MRQPSVTHRHILRIYYIYRGIHSCIPVKPCRRIYLEGSAHDQQDIGSLNRIYGLLYLRHGLAEPYDMRTQLRSVRRKIAQGNRIRAYIEDRLFRISVTVVAAVLGPHLGKLAMEMDHLRTSGPFVQIINILSHDRNLVLILQCCDGKMSRIGFHRCELSPAGIIEIQDKGRVPVPAFDGRYVFHLMVLPQSVAVTESADATFGTYAGAGQNYYLLHGLLFFAIILVHPVLEERIQQNRFLLLIECEHLLLPERVLDPADIR